MTKPIKKQSLVMLSIIYLAGIFMGALDTGIVTPARTIIQNSLGVNDQTGIWMITIYTLAYATSIPIMGKLADRFGRKYIYLTSVLLFGLGSLFCGLSQSFGSFEVLLAARAVQAIGGGGIVPVATAEFGTSFPENKRGMALGLVGGVYGIANIFGASAGSAILDLFGQNNWAYIFYINVPITIFIVIAGLAVLKNTRTVDTRKLDIFGILTITVMILSLLYGLKNLDFFDFGATIKNTDVYPYLLTFLLLIPLFIFIERTAQDPVMNLKYFTEKNIVITLVISFVSGVVLMGVIFVPQFSENALKIASGSGGYFVIVLGLFSGIGAPISGKLIDKFGAKLILGFGFAISVIGSLFMVFVTTNYPNTFTVLMGLILIGTGLGFTMGTPLNYMMLANTDPKESNSSLAALSLIRSIGTAIAPAIMIGFVAHAGASVQTNVTSLLPSSLNVPQLPYAQEISDALSRLRSSEQMKDRLSGFDIPDLTSMNKVEIKMEGSSDYKMPEDLLELLKSSDVTTITNNTKTLSDRMFSEMTPKILNNIQEGVSKGIDGISTGTNELEATIAKMQEGYDGIGKGISGMTQAVAGQKSALSQLNKVAEMLKTMTPGGEVKSIADLIPPSVKAQIPPQALAMLEGIKNKAELQLALSGMESSLASLQQVKSMLQSQGVTEIPAGTSVADLLPPQVKDSLPEQVLSELSSITSIEVLDSKISGLSSAIDRMKQVDAMLPAQTAPQSIADLIPANVKAQIPASALSELEKIKNADELNKKIGELKTAISTLEGKIAESKKSQSQMGIAINQLKNTVVEMKDLSYKMSVLRGAVPTAFEEAKDSYISEIDSKRLSIENAFQSTLNSGFKNVYLVSAIAGIMAIMFLAFYSKRREISHNA